MKILMLRGTMTSLGNFKAGIVYEISQQEGKSLVRTNRAEEVSEATQDVIQETENRSVGLEISEDKPIKRGRPKKVKNAS